MQHTGQPGVCHMRLRTRRGHSLRMHHNRPVAPQGSNSQSVSTCALLPYLCSNTSDEVFIGVL